MSEADKYAESCESLRFCEDFIGQPRDFPKNHGVTLPAPEVKQIPYEETFQAVRDRRKEESGWCKCVTCTRANDTQFCDYYREHYPKLVKDAPGFVPTHGCIDGYSCDLQKLKAYNLRRAVL